MSPRTGRHQVLCSSSYRFNLPIPSVATRYYPGNICGVPPTHRNRVMSAVEAPVLLGRICRSWRSLTTPRLWSRLHVVEPSWRAGAPLAQYWRKNSHNDWRPPRLG
ncbi:hypothetical protein C8F04DRAFT_245444 [Mycena alexandri]|uniref:F-box domain-containing protein n=1 Tax=Mycena alexandri TaxID=1745969 RepID=A0AAD6S6N3_9AGAR|nr:hypothetical protein C8F04DRAFT_245444 [Mycena alexandri]